MRFSFCYLFLQIGANACPLVLLSDFWLVRKAKGLDIYNLYTPSGIYWYTAGVNPRAIAAFFTGMVPLLPGLIFAINPQIGGISGGILDFYTLAWLDGVIIAGCVVVFVIPMVI